MSPLCRLAASFVVGTSIDVLEAAKRKSSADESIASLARTINGLLLETGHPFSVLFSKFVGSTSLGAPPSIRVPDQIGGDQDCKIIRPFNLSNFPGNLSCLEGTPNPYPGHEAHHVFFQQPDLKRRFDEILGYNQLHNPMFGRWMEITKHHQIHDKPPQYNLQWSSYFADREGQYIGYQDILEQGNFIMNSYGFITLYGGATNVIYS